MKRLCRMLAGLLGMALLLTGCSREATLGADITGYNHTTDQSLYYFTVNGNMGPNLDPLGGGGAFTCCVEIPLRWKPGIKVKVWWMYQGGTSVLPPEPPPHTAEIELPPYQPGDIGSVQVHFYPDQKIRVLVAKIGIRHPDYPPELTWEAPPPANAVPGTPLPFPLERNPEFDAQEPGETEEQMRARVAAGQARVKAERDAKQARWDAEVAAREAAVRTAPTDPAAPGARSTAGPPPSAP